jgi:hypothetical protein
MDMVTEMQGSSSELKKIIFSYNIVGVNVLWELEEFFKFADLQYFRHEFATCGSLSPTGVLGRRKPMLIKTAITAGYKLKTDFH